MDAFIWSPSYKTHIVELLYTIRVIIVGCKAALGVGIPDVDEVCVIRKKKKTEKIRLVTSQD
jgi:hypothetical protein